MRTVRRSFWSAVDTYRVIRQWVRNNEMGISLTVLIAAIVYLLWAGFASAAVTYTNLRDHAPRGWGDNLRLRS